MMRKRLSKTIFLGVILTMLMMLLSSCTLTASSADDCSKSCAGCPNASTVQTTRIAIATGADTLTMTGYIMDVHCFVNKPVPDSDSKMCLQMPACAATGYGMAVLQTDSTYKFYYFNGNAAPAATEAQIMAAKLINVTTKKDNIYIFVTGTMSGDMYTSPDGSVYPVLVVSNMSETA